MGKIVRVLSSFDFVLLPSSIGLTSFHGGATTTLTDAEYAALPIATSRGIAVTQSGVADPIRPAIEHPQSLSQTLSLANAYTDSAISDSEGALTSDPALDTWRYAVRNILHRPVNVLGIGDSWEEGQGSGSGFGTGFMEQLQVSLNAALSVDDTSIMLPMWMTAQTGPFTLDAGAGKDNNTGFGMRTAVLRSAGENAQGSFTLQRTGRILVEYGGYGASGPLAVTIDSVLVHTITTTDSAYEFWTSADLAAGTHTLKLTGSGGDIYVTSVTVQDGPGTHGLRFANGGHGGWTSFNWSNDETNWSYKATQTQPDLVIIELGLNDGPAGINPVGASGNTTQANLASIVSTVRANCTTDPSFILFNYPRMDDDTAWTYKWRQYRAEIRAFAASDLGVHLHDVATYLPDPQINNTEGYFTQDSDPHPTAQGVAAMVSELTTLLST